MKKFFAVLLSLCMALSLSVTVFAVENRSAIEEESVIEISSEQGTRNVDYISYPAQLLNGTLVKTAYNVPANTTLKMHIYIEGGGMDVWVKKQGALFYTHKASWTTAGHHYIDLVSNTSAGNYEVKIKDKNGIVTFSGGVYTE